MKSRKKPKLFPCHHEAAGLKILQQLSSHFPVNFKVWKNDQLIKKIALNSRKSKQLDVEFCPVTKKNGRWFLRNKVEKIPNNCLLRLVGKEINASPSLLKSLFQDTESGKWNKKLQVHKNGENTKFSGDSYGGSCTSCFKPPTLIFVSGNKGKQEEFSNIFCGYDVRIVDIDLPEFQGEELFICKEKCKTATQRIRGPLAVEDTSLRFNALNGMPGPYIKDFITNVGAEGLYRMLTYWTDKSAQAICTIGYSTGGSHSDAVEIFQGITHGYIVSPRGEKDTAFGWDSCFEVQGLGKTYAELTKEEKNRVSHRWKAIKKFRYFLMTQRRD